MFDFTIGNSIAIYVYTFPTMWPRYFTCCQNNLKLSLNVVEGVDTKLRNKLKYQITPVLYINMFLFYLKCFREKNVYAGYCNVTKTA